MIFTTSYKGLEKKITNIIEVLKPKLIVELGTQQGHSAVLMAKRGAKVITYDLFKSNYSKSPHGQTHADLQKAYDNTKKYDIQIIEKDALKAHEDFMNTDVLHVDICNYYDNVKPILEKWYKKVNMAILLEGGIENKWQKKNKFKPWHPILREKFITDNYKVQLINGDEGYALTVLWKL